MLQLPSEEKEEEEEEEEEGEEPQSKKPQSKKTKLNGVLMLENIRKAFDLMLYAQEGVCVRMYVFMYTNPRNSLAK